ncbi:MAG: hypothetical protein Q4A59_04730 [Erysipelotrichaceae bacterium]|nr:hypothetical protein [Erysipelotrichaceae bacterium]
MRQIKQLSTIAMSSIVASSLLLAGCAPKTIEITSENAPNEFISQVANVTQTSSPEDMQSILQTINDATMDYYKSGYQTNEDTHAVGLTVQDGQLATTESDFKNYDIRFGDGLTYYELYEEESGNEANYGLMSYNKNAITTVFSRPDGSGQFGKDNGKFVIQTINQEDGVLQDISDDSMKDYIQEAISLPLHNLVGGSLLVSPFEKPQAYAYKLEQVGSDFVWTISIHEQDAYNEILNETFKNMYGYDRLDIKGDGSFILDEFVAKEVTYVVTMDENGVIHKISTTNASQAKKGEVTKEIKSTDIVSLKTVDEKWYTFFKDFFAAIDAGSLKEDDAFALNQPFANTSSSQVSSEQSEAKETTQNDSQESSSQQSSN